MQYKVEKNLLGKQDIIIGKRTITQQRGNFLLPIDGIELFLKVDKINDIINVDTNEYNIILALGGNTINDGLGGFYFYDSTNLQDIDGINVLSTFNDIGRWIKLRLN